MFDSKPHQLPNNWFLRIFNDEVCFELDLPPPLFDQHRKKYTFFTCLIHQWAQKKVYLVVFFCLIASCRLYVLKNFFFTRCFHDTLLCACVWVRFFFDICWYHCSNGRRNQNCCKIHRLRLWFWHWDNFTQRHSGRRILWSEHQYMSALMWYIYQQNQQFEKITFDLHADCHLLYIDDRFWF